VCTGLATHDQMSLQVGHQSRAQMIFIFYVDVKKHKQEKKRIKRMLHMFYVGEIMVPTHRKKTSLTKRRERG